MFSASPSQTAFPGASLAASVFVSPVPDQFGRPRMVFAPWTRVSESKSLKNGNKMIRRVVVRALGIVGVNKIRSSSTSAVGTKYVDPEPNMAADQPKKSCGENLAELLNQYKPALLAKPFKNRSDAFRGLKRKNCPCEISQGFRPRIVDENCDNYESGKVDVEGGRKAGRIGTNRITAEVTKHGQSAPALALCFPLLSPASRDHEERPLRCARCGGRGAGVGVKAGEMGASKRAAWSGHADRGARECLQRSARGQTCGCAAIRGGVAGGCISIRGGWSATGMRWAVLMASWTRVSSPLSCVRGGGCAHSRASPGGRRAAWMLLCRRMQARGAGSRAPGVADLVREHERRPVNVDARRECARGSLRFFCLCGWWRRLATAGGSHWGMRAREPASQDGGRTLLSGQDGVYRARGWMQGVLAEAVVWAQRWRGGILRVINADASELLGLSLMFPRFILSARDGRLDNYKDGRWYQAINDFMSHVICTALQLIWGSADYNELRGGSGQDLDIFSFGIVSRSTWKLIMRTTILTTAITLAVAATGAAARNCKVGTLYCGRSLLQIGKYEDAIKIALRNAGIFGDGDDYLFECNSIFGTVQYVGSCRICVDGGLGHNDHC
ncbi:hypothetical protein DFH09DRAFT_1076686 [Mycena vulgaris]|nr:hypothetical protein DFH09DRAFT_1076686 [Mycena vulgaris]